MNGSTDGQSARAELRADPNLAAPDLVDVETTAVLRKRWLANASGPRCEIRLIITT